MKALVVYESMFGNTHHVASAIGRGLAQCGDVRVGPIADVDPADVADVDLLVVGGPTHVRGLSRESTRAAAVTQADEDNAIDLDEDAPGPGLRAWLDQVPTASDSSCAAFDTRVDKPVLLVGSAARGIGKRLKRLKFTPISDPQSFFVEGNAGPLRDGEEERAQRWAARLANDLVRLNRRLAH